MEECKLSLRVQRTQIWGMRVSMLGIVIMALSRYRISGCVDPQSAWQGPYAFVGYLVWDQVTKSSPKRLVHCNSTSVVNLQAPPESYAAFKHLAQIDQRSEIDC